MEPFFLTCMVVAYFLTKGKVDTAAYSNGKEPPGVVRARMKHDAGGGARTSSGRPTGRGAFGLMLASRWANACEAARQRDEHKAARRRAWYDETAPEKDAAWREKQLRKLERSDWARERWAQARGLISRPTAGTATDPWARRATTTSQGRNQSTPITDSPTSDTDAGPEDGEHTTTDPASPTDQPTTDEPAPGPAPESTTPDPDPPTAGTPPPAARPSTENDNDNDNDDHSSTAATPNQGSSNMYDEAVNRLIQAADQVAEYRSNLIAFADRLAGDGWGTEVTGPLQDTQTSLTAWENLYRDTAERIKNQGDQGAAAYDQAPYVPGPHAVLS